MLKARALVELIRQAGAVDLASTKPLRPEVALSVEAGRAGATDPQGVRLPDGSVRAVLCDPDLFALIVDRFGVPLDHGRHVRWASTAQRHAIARRDGGCVFPGCHQPFAWCDLQHVKHWEHGGGTDLANLAPLCRFHHGVSHRTGWQMFATDDHWFHWTTPTGQTLWSQRHGRRRTGPIPTGDP